MSTVTVFGASDDLIEIRGDLGEEEFGCYGDEGGHLAFSDGTLLSVEYNGFWRFHVLHRGTATVTKVEATNEDTDYSDKVTLTSETPITFVLYGKNVLTRRPHPGRKGRG